MQHYHNVAYAQCRWVERRKLVRRGHLFCSGVEGSMNDERFEKKIIEIKIAYSELPPLEVFIMTANMILASLYSLNDRCEYNGIVVR